MTRGCLVPSKSTAAASSSTAMQKGKRGPWSAKEEELEDWEGPGLKRIKKRLEGMKEEMPEVEPLDALGTTVKASIVAKFEHGYLLRVQVGREKLHGVLYHAPPPDTANPLVPPRVNTTGLALQDGKVILKRAPKKKVVLRKEVLKRDRNAPRPARTGYNFFFSEARTRDREVNPGRDDQERSAAIGEQWRKMTAEDRQVGTVFPSFASSFSSYLSPKMT